MKLKNNRETLVKYKSDIGERIKVVAGIKQICGITDLTNLRGRYIEKYSADVFVDNELIREYSETELPEEDIFFIMPELRKLSESNVDSDELVSHLDTIVAQSYERTQLMIDDPSRFKEFE